MKLKIFLVFLSFVILLLEKLSFSYNYSVYALFMKYNLNSKQLIDAKLEYVGKFDENIEKVLYNKIISYVINSSTFHLKEKNWTQVGIMVIRDYPFSTLVYQTFPIGQYVKIQATGCKKGHCKTKIKTVSTADYVTVMWSCYAYDFNKFKGEPDLRKCRIAYIIHNSPFVYGSGAATKDNIHLKSFIEENFGNYNYFLNTSAALSISIADFLWKNEKNNPLIKAFVFNKQYYYYYIINNTLKTSNLSDEILNSISSGGFDFGDFLIGAILIGGIAGIAYLAAQGVSLAVLGPIGIAFAIIAFLALGSCSAGGSSEAHYDYQLNYYYYKINTSCNSNFCKRFTFSNNQLEGEDFITSPKGSYKFVVPKESLNLIKTIYNMTLNAENISCKKDCSEFINITKKLLNTRYYSVGDLWGSFLAYIRLSNFYGVNIKLKDYKSRTINKWFYYKTNSFANYYKALGYKCNANYNNYPIINTVDCVLNYSGPLYSYLIGEISKIRDYVSLKTDYGAPSPLGATDYSVYSYFAMTSKLLIVDFDYLFSNFIKKGVVGNKLGLDENGPYFLDSNKKKHYLIEKVEIGNYTYYLPALLLIKQPIIGRSESKNY